MPESASPHFEIPMFITVAKITRKTKSISTLNASIIMLILLGHIIIPHIGTITNPKFLASQPLDGLNLDLTN